MGFGKRMLSALGKIGVALSILVLFLIGFLGTVILSLHTSEVKVPDLIGKDRYSGESALSDAGLNIRVARTRASLEKAPDTILWQYPEGGQVVKTGQTVAVEVSRAPKEGESVPAPAETPQETSNTANANQPSTTNQTQNQNRPKNKNTNRNTNKNANNTNNAKKPNANTAGSNTSRNVTGGPSNANRSTNSANRPRTTSPTANRTSTNATRRPPR